MEPIRVLVTGAGSGVGQGIIKSLQISRLEIVVISADISPLNSGLYRTDEALMIPKVEEPGALEALIELIGSNGIQVVMIGSEFDLEFFARHKATIEEKTGAFVVTSPLEAVRISNDKWLTAEFLRKNDLPHALSKLPASLDNAIAIGEEWGFPVVLKTRTGTSNRHVHIASSTEEMARLFGTVPNPMVQQLIRYPQGTPDSEYTCSVFKTKEGELLGPFTARRSLRGGNSWIVEVKEFGELHPLLRGIADVFPTLGTVNIQLMIGEDGPVPFEFNARFSGTTAIRSHFGFNEPEMVLRNYVLGQSIDPVEIGNGVVFRYLEEVFLENESIDSLAKPYSKGTKQAWY